MIRFLKNIKADASVNIELTSFDINAICYDIDILEYHNSYYLDLVRVLWLKLYHLCQNELEANNLKSVDGTEYIFRNKPSKLESLKLLHNEVLQIYKDIQ